MKLIIVMLISYLLGSISFGIIITKLVKGVDIRHYGSGSTGMTNVLRTIGRGPAILVLLGDTFKGSVSVFLGLTLGGPIYAVIGGAMAMIGHAYPVFFRFKGGKGVATGLGIILAISPDVTVIAVTVFLLTLILSRYVSLSSIVGSASVPIGMLIYHKPLPYVVLGFLVVVLVIYFHRANLKRLYEGKEFKIGQKA